MAGTIVCDVISDGAGNSTATDNAIYGSAKAWVNFNGSTAAIRASYNISSITRASTGYYTINFTNTLADANYCALGSYSCDGSTNYPAALGVNTNFSNVVVSPTSSAFTVTTGKLSSSGLGNAIDPTYVNISVFR